METPPAPRPPDPRQREREQLATFLGLLLSLLVGGSFVLFLIFVTLNVFLGVLAVAAATAGFVAIHYLLWGRLEPPSR